MSREDYCSCRAAVAARRPAPSRPVTGQVPAEIKIVILITLSTVKLWTAVVKKNNLPVLRIRIRDPVPFWPLDPGSGMRWFRIPGPYFEELFDKKFYYSLKIDQFFLYHFRTKIIYNFVKFGHLIFFNLPLLLLFLDPGSEICDPGWVKIRIRDTV